MHMYNILSIGRASMFVMPCLEGETYPTCQCGSIAFPTISYGHQLFAMFGPNSVTVL